VDFITGEFGPFLYRCQHVPLGYSNVGVVAEVGAGVAGFQVGERVVSNGAHADMVLVPRNLCARIPDSVDDETAAFTVLASIGLQGLRLAQPTLGECVVVTGVGLIGLLTVQLLQAQGCRVLAIDVDENKLALARQFGAETCDARNSDPVEAGMAFSRGNGVDAVIITATTKSSDPVSQAARMSRKRGRIVLVGVTGLELKRADFYEKELSFQVSCSYGPGRYDADYEQNGQDYPIGYVRWTEQRNFEAVLDLMAAGRLDVKPLISHRFAFEDAVQAYELLSAEKSALGILLQYDPDERIDSRTVVLRGGGAAPTGENQADTLRGGGAAPTGEAVVGFIGAGNYASRTLIPAFAGTGVRLQTLVTSGGVNSVIHGRKAGFAEASTDVDAMLANPDINTVVIATRHDSHAALVIKALRVGKHVFVEKPLCLTMEELEEIEGLYKDSGWIPDNRYAVSGMTGGGISGTSTRMSQSLVGGPPPGRIVRGGGAAPTGEGSRGKGLPLLTVGFNRRFAPHVQKIKSLLAGASGPKTFVMTVNAGAVPADHWTQDAAVGGGRILGEACHFVDLLRYLAGVSISHYDAQYMNSATRDTASINLQFADGSIGTVHYLANGSKRFPKERLEVFAGGRVLQLDNFRKLTGYGWPGFKRMNLWRQDKGQAALVAAFTNAVEQGGAAPIPVEEIFEVMRVCLDITKN
jgi:predicted dehydrogenase